MSSVTHTDVKAVINELASTELPEAAQSLLQFFGYDPTNEALAFDLLSTLLEHNQWEAIEKLLAAVVGDFNGSARVISIHAFALMRKASYEEALQRWLDCRALGAEDGNIDFNEAFCRFHLSQYQACVDLLKPLLDENLEHVLTLYVRALHYLERTTEALALIEAHPAELGLELESIKALMLYEEGRPEQALDICNRRIDAGELNLELILARGEVYKEQGDMELAEADFRTATEHYPKVGRVWSNIAQLEYYRMDFEAAKQSVDLAVQYMPDHIGTWHLKAWIHLLENDTELALASFLKSYDIDRNFGETHGGLASCYTLLGQADKAKKHYKLAKRLDPEGFAANYADYVGHLTAGDKTRADFVLNQFMDNPVRGSDDTPRQIMQAYLNAQQSQKEH